MKDDLTLVTAIILTATLGLGTVVLTILDPIMTPLRLVGLIGVATALGGSWGGVIWNRRRN